MTEAKKSQPEDVSRRRYLEVAGGTIAGLVVGGVGGYLAGHSTAPTITAASTMTQTVTQAVTQAVTGAAAPKIGEGYSIVLISGDEADAFTTTIVKGGTDARDQFGNALTVLYSKGWDAAEFLTNLRTAIALKPNAIIFSPFGDPAVLTTEIATAYAQGTVVTLMNLDVPEIRAKFEPQCGSIAQDLSAIGAALAAHAIEEFGLGKGDRCAVMCGFWTEPTFSKRTYGIYDTLVKAGCTVDKIVHPPQIFAAPEGGLAYISGYVAAHPDVKFIAFGGAGTTAVVDYYMQQMGKAPGSIQLAGFDLTSGALKCIKEGYLSFTMDQQPYLYGYLTTLNLILTMKYGFRGWRVDTAGGWVDKTNVDAVVILAQEHIR
jgi:simple sugar transport system substrate-binding protein